MTEPDLSPQNLTALIVDWGGVLTVPLDGVMSSWAASDGVQYDHFREVLRCWSGARATPLPGGAGAEGADSSPMHQLERGELEVPDFEKLLASELAAMGSPVPADGLLRRMLSGLDDLDVSMMGMLRRAKASGLKLALLSNSWGSHYPDELWDGLFDAIVISGEVGMRKPEHRIYEHTAQALGVTPSSCVMVDDIAHNIHAAVQVGMVGVRHTSYLTTANELEVLFGRDLA